MQNHIFIKNETWNEMTPKFDLYALNNIIIKYFKYYNF